MKLTVTSNVPQCGAAVELDMALSRTEVAFCLGLSRQVVAAVERKAMQKVAAALAERGLDASALLCAHGELLQ